MQIIIRCSQIKAHHISPPTTNLTEASKPAVTKSSSRGGLTGFLEEKTGVTGAWTLGVGVSAYLISKELYVINSEASRKLKNKIAGISSLL